MQDELSTRFYKQSPAKSKNLISCKPSIEENPSTKNMWQGSYKAPANKRDRDPILQDSQVPQSKPLTNRSQFEKYYKSSIFETGNKPLDPPSQNRVNQKFSSSRVFEGEEVKFKPSSRKFETKRPEIEEVFSHEGKEIHKITAKPNSRKLNSSDLAKNTKEASLLAQSFHERRVSSSIFFS